METNQFTHVVLVLTALSPLAGFAAPLTLTKDGPAGNSNEGFGMPLSEMREQLDRYWAEGQVNIFFIAGKQLSSALQERQSLYDSITAQTYIDTSLGVLARPNATDKFPHPGIVLSIKAEIGRMLLGGDYIYYYFGGADYRKNRTAVLEAGISLLDALRKDYAAGPLAMERWTPFTLKPGLSEEERAAAYKQRRDEDDAQRAKSMAVLCRKRFPEAIARLEKAFTAFAEQEYRRIPPEKDEMESIIARAGLPKEATERLNKLIPR